MNDFSCQNCGHSKFVHHKTGEHYPCGSSDPIDSCMEYKFDNLKYLEDKYESRTNK